MQGARTWAHALAIVDKGEVIASVVYLPMLDKLYSAQKGGGAFLQQRPDHAFVARCAQRCLSPRSAPCDGPGTLACRAGCQTKPPPLSRLSHGTCRRRALRRNADSAPDMGVGHRRGRSHPSRSRGGNLGSLRATPELQQPRSAPTGHGRRPIRPASGSHWRVVVERRCAAPLSRRYRSTKLRRIRSGACTSAARHIATSRAASSGGK